MRLLNLVSISGLLLTSAFLAGAAAEARETTGLVLADNGGTAYRIVVADSAEDERMAASLERAASVLQAAFAKNGAELEIVPESLASGNPPTIHLGPTQFAREHGVVFDPDSGWEYAYKVAGDNLIIAGNDVIDPIPLEKRREREARFGGVSHFGTLKAVADFVYQYAGVRFLFPGKYGTEYLDMPVIAVPADLDHTFRPHGKNLEVERSSDLYYYANGLEPTPLALTNYGHYHHTAVSSETHGESNPEYFVLRSNQRDNQGIHLCFSNPEVREIIYQRILEDVDTGYDIIEMGQNDGFIPCSCDECYAHYGVHPVTTPDQGIMYIQDPAWGEKLWIMHRDMALRLQKDRPDAKLMISAYSVARNPPQTFDSLPENVIVQIMAPDAEILDKWSRIDVPGGYAAYTYISGRAYPRNALQNIDELVDTMVGHDIRLMQNNLKPRSRAGLLGPNFYVLGRRMNDPEGKSAQELYSEYIEAAFGEVSGTMKQFFRRLDQRLNSYKNAEEIATFNRDLRLLFNTLYTPDLMNKLDELLTQAEEGAQTENVEKRLEAIRFEFDTLRRVSTVLQLYYTFLAVPEQETFDRLLDALDERHAWAVAHVDGEYRDRFNSVPVGWRVSGGRGSVADTEPFNWDTGALRAADEPWKPQPPKQAKVARATGPVTLESNEWAVAPQYTLQPNAGQEGDLRETTVFQMMYDDQNLYVRVEGGLPAELMNTFTPRGRDAELWLQESVNILLAPEGDRSQYYYLTYEPVEDSFIDATHGYITDPLHPQYGWNDQTWDGRWEYVNDLQADNDRWVSMAVIPFATLNTPRPTPGTIWSANISRLHYFKELTSTVHRDRLAAREMAVWTGKFPGSKNPGEADMGDIQFQ